jgi:hypothetical protein
MSENNESKELIDGVFKEILEENIAGLQAVYLEMEQVLFDTYGDPDEIGEIWAVISSVDAQIEASSDEEDHLLLSLCAKGPNIYDGLEDDHLAVASSLIRGRIGSLIRAGAWSSPTTEGKPSEHPLRKSNVITTIYSSGNLFMFVRSDDGEVDAVPPVVHHKLEQENHKLGIALKDFDQRGEAIHDGDYEYWVQIVKDLEAQE